MYFDLLIWEINKQRFTFTPGTNWLTSCFITPVTGPFSNSISIMSPACLTKLLTVARRPCWPHQCSTLINQFYFVPVYMPCQSHSKANSSSFLLASRLPQGSLSTYLSTCICSEGITCGTVPREDVPGSVSVSSDQEAIRCTRKGQGSTHST
jgi:hypothetical protein